MGLLAGSVTVGTVYTSATRLQNAVDAAALAAAQEASRGNVANVGSQAAFIPADAPGASGTVTVDAALPNTVQASGTLSVPGGFAALFGKKSFTVRATALASWGPGAAFDYAIFQGDSSPNAQALTLNGAEQVTGSVHSNNDLVLNGHVEATGSCGGNPTVTANGSVACQSGIIQHAPNVPMPQWTTEQVTPSDATVIGSPTDPVETFEPTGSVITGNYIIYGNVVFGPSQTVEGNYLVYGNVTFNGNNQAAGSVTSWGGSIVLNGQLTQSLPSEGIALAAFTADGGTGETAGNITVNGSDTIDGTLYAPDGTITLNGSTTVDGAVVGNLVVLNGSSTVDWNGLDVQAVPVQQVSLIR
jgi:cytoskeletal protein CcmA (bactofilin family)